LKDEIKNHQNLNKKAKEKKIKEEPNWKILHMTN
jgi:hypothetical protein